MSLFHDEQAALSEAGELGAQPILPSKDILFHCFMVLVRLSDPHSLLIVSLSATGRVEGAHAYGLGQHSDATASLCPTEIAGETPLAIYSRFFAG